MYDLQNKQVLVIGLGERGRAACRLLRDNGANVMAVDEANTPALRAEAEKLRPLGIEVQLGVKKSPDRQFSLAVVSPAVPGETTIMREMAQRQVPVIGEFELGYQQSHCLNIAVTGSNGKGTTGELIEALLTHHNRKTALCGHGGRPACSVVRASKEHDFLIFQVNALQLETTAFFRPAVAVLLNLAPDHLDRFGSKEAYVRAVARLFQNQQAFDWAIIQSEALAELRAAGIELPSKIITFSAHDQNADIFFDRGLLISKVANWSGPLLDTAQCRLQGMHNAENLMAALAVGHVLHLPLDGMIEVLKNAAPGPHRFETVAEINEVRFINDAKATNVDALRQALLSIPSARGGLPNVWLIAGGRDKGLDFHSVGPVLSQRVKGAFLIGEAREKIHAAWGLFTPCTAAESLLEAVKLAAESAAPGDVVLLSPACSSFDQFRNYQHRGEVFRETVNALAVSAGVENKTGSVAASQPTLKKLNNEN
jgi:UDP-N-acetylmuramoylalanine--D-glutamate ligase